jgi:hypothetical protein
LEGHLPSLLQRLSDNRHEMMELTGVHLIYVLVETVL